MERARRSESDDVSGARATRRGFIRSGAGAIAGLALGEGLLPRLARAAAGFKTPAYRFLGFTEVAIPGDVKRSVAAAIRLLSGEGFSLKPIGYNFAYDLRGEVHRETRVWDKTRSGRHSAGILARGGATPEALAFVETYAPSGDLEVFRLFSADDDEASEIARIHFAGGNVTRIQVAEASMYSTEQVEWLGRALARPPADENCICCQQCCFPHRTSTAGCGLIIGLVCGTGPVSRVCTSNGYAAVVCVVTCWGLDSFLCRQTQITTDCGSCSGHCDLASTGVFKPRCCPGQVCGHTGCVE